MKISADFFLESIKEFIQTQRLYLYIEKQLPRLSLWLCERINVIILDMIKHTAKTEPQTPI